ncbi:MAG TPA: biotin/lipoyl-containing protein, partial [Vicinamibacterales bacterium]|nr:biotin/lipoyl-containing protein [Vicinamibacterales bacterium]
VAGERVTVAGEESAARVTAAGDGRWRVAEPEAEVTGLALRHGDVVWVSVDGHTFEFRVRAGARRGRASARDADALAAPMPATVVRIAVKPGDAVTQGDVLIALEAMKMEMPIRAPRDGVVASIDCREGELVQPGVPLMQIT